MRLTSGFFVGALALSLPSSGATFLPRGANSTAANDKLQTWWHSSGEVNPSTPVLDGNVRQSRVYTVEVASTGDSADHSYYDSFVYESIPRSGNGMRLSPTNDSLGGNVDGVSIEPDVGINMAWTQFLYASDVTIKITRAKGYAQPDPSKVIIRPTTTSYDVTSKGQSLYIKIPYSSNGQKLSVEFQDDLWSYHTGGSDGLFVQNVVPNGHNYVSSYNSTEAIVGIEPINSLLIFASAFPPSDQIPSESSNDTYVVPQGLVSTLQNVTQSTVYFAPGVYWFGGANHAILPPSVSWVHFAPGSYVKGAIEYNTTAPLVRATGHGVLSGEQYVYQANVADGYNNNKSDATSLRMWSGSLTANQTWICHGPTINAPPFNTMDFNGEPVSHVSDYKQVGAFFWQTDGMEVYPNSTFSDIFYHVGDDCIKTYYSDVDVQRLVVWKTTNDPIFQMGWAPRNVTNVTASDISVIHTRYPSANTVVPTALIGASPNYLNSSATNNADLSSRIANFNLTNLRCEGLCPSLVRWNPLQNFDNFTVSGVSIDSFPPNSTGIGQSVINKFTNANGTLVSIGGESPGGVGLTIRDYYVGGEKISLAANNWQSAQAGQMNIDAAYWGHWTIE